MLPAMLSANNVLKSGLSKSLTVTTFNRSYTTSYQSAIVTIALSCTNFQDILFLCAGIEYERGGPQHPAHGGVTFPGILFMTWWAQGVMNGWLLVFLSSMCCHKASWAVVRLLAFQGVRRKSCMLPPFGNFWPCLSMVNFSHFLPFDFVVGILEYLSVFWLVIIFLIDK